MASSMMLRKSRDDTDLNAPLYERLVRWKMRDQLGTQAHRMKNYFQKIMFIPPHKVMPSPQPSLNRLALVFEIMSLLRLLNPHTKPLEISSSTHVLQKDPHSAGVKTGVAHALQVQTPGHATWKQGSNPFFYVPSENSRFKASPLDAWREFGQELTHREKKSNQGAGVNTGRAIFGGRKTTK